MSDQDNYDTPESRGETGIIQGIIQLILVIAFIVTSFTISGMLGATKKTLGKRPVENRAIFAQTETLTPQSYRIEFETTGIIQARSEISIVPQVSGRVISVNEKFFEGGTFEKDEVLFEIEPLDFELTLREIEAKVAQARTTYNLAEAETAAAIAEWKQIHGDKKVPYLVSKRPQKDEAWANLKAAKAQLKNAQLDLERTKFSMPFAGRVLSSTLEQGQYISAGQNYGHVYDMNTLETQASLEDKQLNWLLNAQSLNILVNTTYLGEKQSYDAVLNRGISSLNTQTRFATVSFGFKSPPENIIPGVFVNLHIKGSELQNIYLVPINALQKNESIWAVNDKNALYKIEAERLFINDKYIVIRDLEPQTHIVTSKIPGAIEGMIIQTPQSAANTSKDNDKASAL